MQKWATTKTKIKQIKKEQIIRAGVLHISFVITNLKTFPEVEKVQEGGATMFHTAL